MIRKISILFMVYFIIEPLYVTEAQASLAFSSHRFHLNQLPILPNVKMAKRAESTIKSFEYLDTYALDLAQSPLISTDALCRKLNYIVENPEKFKTPDCPELDLIDSPPFSEMIFQKVNRWLFEEFDDFIYECFKRNMNYNTNLSFPVVEWAVNVIPNFELPIVSRMPGSDLTTKIENFIKAYYFPQNIETYLKRGAVLLDCWVKKIEQEMENDARPLSVDLEKRLQCDMCYPARISALSF